MATRTIRLDPEAEQALASLTRSTGLSISEVLKRGLMAYKQQAQDAPAPRAPYDVFRRLDLGPGGYARLRQGREARCKGGDRPQARPMILLHTAPNSALFGRTRE